MSVLVEWVRNELVVGPGTVELQLDGVFSIGRRGRHLPGNLSEVPLGAAPGTMIGQRFVCECFQTHCCQLDVGPNGQYDPVAVFHGICATGEDGVIRQQGKGRAQHRFRFDRLEHRPNCRSQRGLRLRFENDSGQCRRLIG